MRRAKLLFLALLLSAGTLGIAKPAAATSCDLEDGVDAAFCVVHGTPVVGDACTKLRLC